MGLYRVPGHSELQGNRIADKLARDGSVPTFVGLDPSLGVSRQKIRRKIKRWMDNQHLVRWRGLGSTQRQARGLILGPSLVIKTRLLSSDRVQSRVEGCYWSAYWT